MTHKTLRRVALAILGNPEARLTRKAGSFLGQVVADPTPLTDKQTDWFCTLAERAGVPLPNGGAND